MFTIDLLNGQGIPPKTRPGGVAIVAITAAVPVLLAVGMVGLYQNNKVALSLMERDIARGQAKIDTFSDALEQREALKEEKNAYGTCLSEVSASLKKHTQWSPILTTVIENMPDSVVLTSLEVKRNSVTKEVPSKDDPGKKEEIEVPARVLCLSVSGGPQCREAVRDFQDRLRRSALLGPRLENIIVSRNSETVKGQDVFSYDITCAFEPGL